MPALKFIKEPITADIARYEEFLRTSLRSGNSLTEAMLDYIFESRGKALRPVLSLLTASVYAGGRPLGDRSLLAAMLVEMMHTASLVHDDVIDESDLRRGKPSVKAVWKSRSAVLIGDYILAKSYGIGMKTGHYDIVDCMVDAMTNMCDGELLQSEHSGKFDLTCEVYDRIIYRKTACLIGVSACTGAMSVDAGGEAVELMRRFGDSLGMAFQIKDDILDYHPSSETGKTPCADIREGKINLPFLLVLERAPEEVRERMRRLMEIASADDNAAQELSRVVTGHGGIELATAEMDGYIRAALDILSVLPPSRYRESLEALCPYITKRNH
ncbi:MAG: polyprenyl synthetase family protein [Alistipes sp.]|nr:polyprenyl synthetase family protein [Alistipes sp.]